MKTIRKNNQDNLQRNYNVKKKVDVRTSSMIKCREMEYRETRTNERN